MIAAPHNDKACLGAITEEIAKWVRDRDPAIVELAQVHDDTAALAMALRERPQRDDTGQPCDGPKVHECEPPQRLRKDPPDPNCVERAGTYVAAAELLDPVPVRRLATVRTPEGALHTFPTEDGEPVVLDPLVSRNALAAGLFHAMRPRNGAADVTMSPTELVDWIAQISSEPALRFTDGVQRVRNGHRAVRGLLVGRPLCVADVRDVALMLALADRESRLWGPTGPRLVGTAVRAVDQLDRAAAGRWQAATNAAPRNAVELNVGGYRLRPDVGLLAALGRVGGRLGTAAGLEALKVKLAALGVSPPVLTTLERELNREGLSLGRLASPPPIVGSWDALTPESLAGRWLASKL